MNNHQHSGAGMAVWLRTGVLILVLISSLAISVLGALNYSGYCLRDNKFLTSREKIDIAASYFLATYPPVISHTEVHQDNGVVKRVNVKRRPMSPIPYRDLKEFYVLNPSCCDIVANDPEGYSVDFWGRVCGTKSVLVRVRYVVRYTDDDRKVQLQPVEFHVVVSNCGDAWNGV